MVDPDMGTWTYAYNALGELVRQTDAKNQVTTMAYDLLGRMTLRAEPDLVSKWFYDAYPTGAPEWIASMTTGLSGDCSRGKGKLCFASADNGYRRIYGYETGTTNAAARPLSSRTRIDGTDYTIAYAYNANGQLAQTTYPASNMYAGGFITKNVYTTRGYLHKVTDNAGTTVFWQANTMSARGEILTQSQAGGVINTTNANDALGRLTGNTVTGSGGTSVQSFTYAYDTIGNLTQRIDGMQANLTENFVFDKLNRLVQSSGNNITTRAFDHNALGNITSKSGVGTYNYNPQGTPCSAGGGGGPHAVCSITGTVNGVANPTFTYDANGNQVTGLNRTITYTSFNMPASVTSTQDFTNQPGPTSVTYAYTYTYNSEHERLKHTITRWDGSTYTTVFLHPAGKGALLYEKETKPNGAYDHKHYITARGLLVGVHLAKHDGTTETRYFHKDHLGSISLITTSAGATLEQLAYDAWGKRRNPNGTEDSSNALYGLSTDRGYTAHEHLDEMALIHMNGRVYDPVLARFVSADPILRAPTNLQSYNRYAYGFNSPLAGSDPTQSQLQQLFARGCAQCSCEVNPSTRTVVGVRIDGSSRDCVQFP